MQDEHEQAEGRPAITADGPSLPWIREHYARAAAPLTADRERLPGLRGGDPCRGPRAQSAHEAPPRALVAVKLRLALWDPEGVGEPHIKRLAGGQIVRSGRHGHYVITRDMVSDAFEHLQEHPAPVNLEHDPTQLPVGRVIAGHLVELDDGEVALESEMEIFTGTIPVAFYPASQLAAAASALGAIVPEEGPLEILIDDRSYQPEDLELLRQTAAQAGKTKATDGALRFSQLPDALLVFGLGSAASATWWFSRNFFSKLGDELGTEVGQDLVLAYRSLKAKLREVVRRRQPADRPPLTMITLTVEREDGAVVDVEGSSRADDDKLDDFLDGGHDLLAVARVYAQRVPQPDRLRKLHFAREDGAWRLRYALDEEARPVLVAALSDKRYAELLAEAEDDTSTDA